MLDFDTKELANVGLVESRIEVKTKEWGDGALVHFRKVTKGMKTRIEELRDEMFSKSRLDTEFMDCVDLNAASVGLDGMVAKVQQEYKVYKDTTLTQFSKF